MELLREVRKIEDEMRQDAVSNGGVRVATLEIDRDQKEAEFLDELTRELLTRLGGYLMNLRTFDGF